MKARKRITIAIDGHSSCGKSTVAKELARAIGIAYIDTGAMYRATTLYAMRHGLYDGAEPDVEGLTARLSDISITFDFDAASGRNVTFLGGENVEEEIRSLEVSRRVSQVSAISAVRAVLTEWQRRMGSEKSVVMDGRDIGTVVFPSADLKIFMTARPEVRAKRRYDEMVGKGETPDYAEVLASVVERDRIDSTREVSPLRQAEDAVVLDNSDMTREGQYEFILDELRRRGLIED